MNDKEINFGLFKFEYHTYFLYEIIKYKMHLLILDLYIFFKFN